MLSNCVVDDKAYDRLETEWANLVAAAEWLWQTAAVQGEEVGDEEAARSLNDLAKALRNFLRFGGRLDELGQLRTRADKAMRAVNNRGNASDMTKAALSDPATFWREIIPTTPFILDLIITAL